MKLIDALGVEHRPLAKTETPRIVSLVPSLTELLCELGLADALVGRTGFCIHPADTVRGIAKVGGTKDVNIEKIRRLAPTHLVVNIDENEKPTVDALAAFVPVVIVIAPPSGHAPCAARARRQNRIASSAAGAAAWRRRPSAMG